MITVTVFINTSPVLTRTAVNKGFDEKAKKNICHVDDGSVILHKRDDGAAKLAIEMLKKIKEPINK